MKDNRYSSLIRKNRDIAVQRKQDKWAGSENEDLKAATPTVLGDFGENTIADIFNDHGYKAEVINKGKGDFDILVNGKIRFEGKTATEDTKGYFQFNGIKKKGVEYDYVIGVGVGPNEIYINMWTKQHCVDNLTTPMAKNATDGFKLSASPRRGSCSRKWEVYLLDDESFENHILKEIV